MTGHTTAAASSQQISFRDVQAHWHLLDAPNFEVPVGIRLISHESFTDCSGLCVDHITPCFLVRMMKKLPLLRDLAYAAQLILRCERNTVLILNGSGTLPVFIGLLNHLMLRARRVLCWDIFVEVDNPWKRAILRTAMSGMTICVLWSQRQVPAHARFLNMREDRFIFIPYKANHSKHVHYNLPIANYVFSGGNGKRDYACLIEAVRGTDIPVIISTTDPMIRRSVESLPNVIVLGAPEPAFAQLQAASKFIVIPMIYTGIKGGGEANFCNGMWHGKPVIAADSIAAADYIIDGVTGFVVPSGDSMALRERILELWHNPELVTQMGTAAARHAEEQFTHQAFVRRLLRLAVLLGISKS